MDILRSPEPNGPASAFLVERYLSASAAGDLASSVARVARLCAAPGVGVSEVRYLQSVYLPAEDTCFCIFQAPSIDAIRAVNDDGQFPIDRIARAVLMIGTEEPS